MTLPAKITPCPIIDALLEIRFVSTLPEKAGSAVFGVVYNAFRDRYPDVDELPILQIPEPMRKDDPGFKFKPLYKASNKGYVLQVGPNVVTISSFPDYAGWEAFSREIYSVIDTLADLDVVKEVIRVGYHVINFFDKDIFPESNLRILIDGNPIDYRNTSLQTSFVDEKARTNTVVMLKNEARFRGRQGSIIDIDSYTLTEPVADFFGKAESIVENLHLSEKNAFFSLLSPSLLESLSPEFAE